MGGVVVCGLYCCVNVSVVFVCESIFAHLALYTGITLCGCFYAPYINFDPLIKIAIVQ